MDVSIGELSRQTGVKVPTIRYYEQVGLLPAPVRTEGKQRRYGPGDIMRLNFIKHGRELGFEVNDIRELLALSAQPERPCENADRITRRHLTAVDQRIAQLAALQAELTRMLGSCSGGCVADCQILESLSTPTGEKVP
ncbi:MerR family transcriptional regulator [Nitrobacter winogradskyi]|uniref:DNA-binding transcriptional MerR regulator n=2 Tax=Nitrobacter winogradskyi TaxID=913 RepID=A0ACC6ANY2_NITWI|nr:helix-turn-helix domain-containing protein [Nitrobacter winogradskyi]MCP2001391.1 DNA-binding transcriptional MerR regulator [Nitrobacter winogradskyi]GEC15437.1 MerR family transcriptional regulator [Nitrobacter winogradskyi]